MYIGDVIYIYDFNFYQIQILEEIDNATVWKTPNYNLKLYFFILCLAQHSSLNDYENSNITSLMSIKVCFK